MDKKYSDSHGALKNKAEFARKAIKNINNYNDLTEEAKRLIEKIVGFIKENNNK